MTPFTQTLAIQALSASDDGAITAVINVHMQYVIVDSVLAAQPGMHLAGSGGTLGHLGNRHLVARCLCTTYINALQY